LIKIRAREILEIVSLKEVTGQPYTLISKKKRLCFEKKNREGETGGLCKEVGEQKTPASLGGKRPGRLKITCASEATTGGEKSQWESKTSSRPSIGGCHSHKGTVPLPIGEIEAGGGKEKKSWLKGKDRLTKHSLAEKQGKNETCVATEKSEAWRRDQGGNPKVGEKSRSQKKNTEGGMKLRREKTWLH